MLLCLAEVKSVSVDVAKEEVLVESSLTSAEVQALIENTGRRAVLKGLGGSQPGEDLRNATFLLPIILGIKESFLMCIFKCSGLNWRCFDPLRGLADLLNDAFLSS